MIKFLLWLLLGRKLSQPYLSIVERPKPRNLRPEPNRRYSTVLLRQALIRERGAHDLPVLPVRPWRKAPPHKNEPPPGSAVTTYRPQFGPVRPPSLPVPWYGDETLKTEDFEDDEDGKSASDAAILRAAVARHYADPYGVHGRACERDSDI